MGMSVSPQIWQQFVDLVFQDDLIKCKQNFDVIMDDTFIYVVRRRGRLAPGQPLSVPHKRVTGICGFLGILATV